MNGTATQGFEKPQLDTSCRYKTDEDHALTKVLGLDLTSKNYKLGRD
jgi:hypothetical protein